MNKFLYKNIYWLYFFIASIRMTFYIIVGKEKEAKKIINEHNDWQK